MTKGILLFCFNSRELDYALLSIISAGFAKKNLDKPVSLVTDSSTVDWMRKSKILSRAKKVFDKIIEIPRPDIDNYRNLHDGSTKHTVPFINQTRHLCWDLTPYQRTLVIDSDYLIQNDSLNHFWDIDQDILISSGIKDIFSQERLGYMDHYISETGVKLYWATAFMFTKNAYTKSFFETIKYIKDNYSAFSAIFRFNQLQYRNDISFSIAKHVLEGFDNVENYSLPSIYTALDKDILYKIENDKLFFLVDTNSNGDYSLISQKDVNIHIMNKKSMTRLSNELLEII